MFSFSKVLTTTKLEKINMNMAMIGLLVLVVLCIDSKRWATLDIVQKQDWMAQNHKHFSLDRHSKAKFENTSAELRQILFLPPFDVGNQLKIG